VSLIYSQNKEQSNHVSSNNASWLLRAGEKQSCAISHWYVVNNGNIYPRTHAPRTRLCPEIVSKMTALNWISIFRGLQSCDPYYLFVEDQDHLTSKCSMKSDDLLKIARSSDISVCVSDLLGQSSYDVHDLFTNQSLVQITVICY